MTTTLTDQDVAAIKATTANWTKSCLDRNWDSLLTMCTEDVTFLPPTEPLVHGRDAVFAYLSTYPVMKKFDFSFDDVDGRGDFATGRGTFTMTVEHEGDEVSMKGKFIDTFRKQADGTWLYRDVIWNTDSP